MQLQFEFEDSYAAALKFSKKKEILQLPAAPAHFQTDYTTKTD